MNSSWRIVGNFAMGLLPDMQAKLLVAHVPGNAGNIFPATAGLRSRHALLRDVRGHTRAVMKFREISFAHNMCLSCLGKV